MEWPPDLLESSIANFMTVGVPSVGEDMPAKQAAQVLEESPAGVVFITDANKVLKGVITRGDMFKFAKTPAPEKAKDLGTMEQNVVAIASGAQLWQLLKIMNGEKPLDALPVVDKDTKKALGVVYRDTLRQALPQKLAAFQKF